MNALRRVLWVIALVCVAPAGAAPVTSALVGHWRLDVSSLLAPATMRPKQVDLTFHADADGRWNSHVEIVDQNDKVLFSESTLTLDGTPGRATGTYWVDLCAATLPAPNVLVMQFAYHGAPTSTRVYSLSADGNVLTETEAFFKADGTPAMRTALFRRAP